MKNNRQQAILQIITANDVETQEMLLQKLLEKGFSVTQATVSRDIKKMGLVKEADPTGKYRYVCHKTQLPQQSAKYVNILKETMTDIVSANNLVIIKTYPGMANAAAAAFDTIFKADVLGSIAGDDTVFVATATADIANSLAQQIKEITK